MITQDELKSIIDYDPDTGIFTWKITSGNAIKGERAGSIYGNGYRYVGYNHTTYLCSRLAHLYMMGEFPSDDVEMDHIDKNRANDRWSNLRVVSRSINNHNKNWTQHKNKTNGLPVGVYKCKHTNRYRAKCKINKKQKHIGYYDTIEEAFDAYLKYIQINLGEDAANLRKQYK